MSFTELGKLTERSTTKKQSLYLSTTNLRPNYKLKKKNVRYLKTKNPTDNENIKLAQNLYTRNKIYNFQNMRKLNQKISYTNNNNEIKNLTPKYKRTLKKFQSQKNIQNLNLKKNPSILFQSFILENTQENNNLKNNNSKNKKKNLKSLAIKKQRFSKTNNPLKTSIDIYYKRKNNENRTSNCIHQEKKKKIKILSKKNSKKNSKENSKENSNKKTQEKIEEKLTIIKNERNYKNKLKKIEKENLRLKTELSEQLSLPKNSYKKKYENLQKDFLLLKEEKIKLEKNMSKKLFHMYLQTEKNNRKNMEAHTRELSYRYGCNNDETIVLLKDYVKELKENLEIIQCDTEKYYKVKYDKIIEEKNNQIEILKDLLNE